MKCKNLLLILVSCAIVFNLNGQSATTDALHKKHSDALALFFYNNTLRMLNQNDDPEFDALIKDIEKMKFLMIKKGSDAFDYKKLVRDYKAEAFEEVMSSRHSGKNFDVYVKEKDGKTKGMLVLVNDSTDLYVLDILGQIALNKVANLYNTLDQSADIGKKIKAFAGGGDDKKESDHKDH